MTMPPVHPAAAIFPLMGEAELRALADDIKANGQREPIVFLDGKLLDGRNRWLACELAGVKPRRENHSGMKNPVEYVWSLNYRRRHLDESQRAMAAERYRQLLAEPAANLPTWSSEPITLTPPEPQSPTGRLRDVAAEKFNVSSRLVDDARVVQKSGVPELVEAVDAREVAVSAAVDIAKLPPEKQREIIAKADPKLVKQVAKELRSEKQEERRAERIERIERIARGNAPLDGAARFPILLADPPWRYDFSETESRAIENQYPTLSLDEICALPIGDMATQDAALFLWHPAGKATEAVRVVTAWGFRERSSWVWVKESIGPGYWGRLRHEMLMICTRGDFPAPAPSDRFDSVIEQPRGEHSAKPVEAMERIERMYPTLPKIELFARAPREGWERWGNQANERLAG
jgi:N6-adenosine-specific RNA methylase IME4